MGGSRTAACDRRSLVSTLWVEVGCVTVAFWYASACADRFAEWNPEHVCNMPVGGTALPTLCQLRTIRLLLLGLLLMCLAGVLYVSEGLYFDVKKVDGQAATAERADDLPTALLIKARRRVRLGSTPPTRATHYSVPSPCACACACVLCCPP